MLFPGKFSDRLKDLPPPPRRQRSLARQHIAVKGRFRDGERRKVSHDTTHFTAANKSASLSTELSRDKNGCDLWITLLNKSTLADCQQIHQSKLHALYTCTVITVKPNMSIVYVVFSNDRCNAQSVISQHHAGEVSWQCLSWVISLHWK